MSHAAVQPAVLVLALLFASPIDAQESVKQEPGKASPQKPTKKQKHMVRFSFKAGTVTHRVLDQDMNMTMNMGAKDMVTNIKMSMWMTASIVAVKGNTADIEQKITRMPKSNKS